MKTILGISGSLRKDSLNTKLLKAFEAELPKGLEMQVANISALPLFNADLEANFPNEAKTLKEQIKNADAVIITTPEYNRSVPGVLKNAIDWGSRPSGDNSWAGKKVFVASASPGRLGGALANYHLKQSLLHLNTVLVGQPEFFLSGAKDKFDDNGELTDDMTKEIIQKALAILSDT